MDSTNTYSDIFKNSTQAFDPKHDIEVLSRISETYSTLQRRRKDSLDSQINLLRELSRRLESLKSSVSEQQQDLTLSASQDNNLLNLEKQKFNLAKQINLLESSNNINSTKLAQLNQELEAILDLDVLQTSTADIQDSTVLKLNVYKSLGITFDGDSPDSHKKVLIHSHQSNNIHTLLLTDYKPYFVSNYIWDKL